MERQAKLAAKHSAGGGPSSLTLLGDFNSDSVVTETDIDLLFAAVHNMGNPLDMDLTNDQLVDRADIDQLVRVILRTNYGDLDLDGHIDSDDFQVLSANFMSVSATWKQGDLNGDRSVTFTDFVILTNHIG